MKNSELDSISKQARDRVVRPPLFSVLSLIAIPVFAFGSIPYWRWSVDHQIATSQEIYSPDPGQFGSFAVIGGSLIAGAIGALMGLVLAFVARARVEKWPWLRVSSFFINAVGALFGSYLLCLMLMK